MRGVSGVCRFLAAWRVLALVMVPALVMAVIGVSAQIASASSAAHRPPRHGAQAGPGAGLSLARAPAGLRAAVRRTLGAPAGFAGSAFQQAELTASDPAGNDVFGVSVAVAGSTAVVGARGHGPNGSAYVFVRSGSTWHQQDELTAPSGSLGGHFGTSVALSGSTAVVGAPGTASGTGAAYVFTRSGSTWPLQAILIASDNAANDVFGSSVAVAGSTAVVGAPEHGPNGSAYVFVRSGSTWRQQDELTAPSGSLGGVFGTSVALSGSTAVVGAPGTASGTGAAYVFTRSGSTWPGQAILTGAAGGNFGSSVALSGSTAVVGAPGTASGTGAAYVFTRSGSTWPQRAELAAAGGTSGDNFGSSVALSGSTAVVGAPGTSSVTGAAYVFVRSGSTWSQQAGLTAADAAHAFGNSVAISGSTAVVGAPGTNTFTGTAYVFALPSQQAALTASDGASGHFGFAVAVSGSTAVVGAPGTNSGTGAAYVYVRSRTGAWSQQATLTAANGTAGDAFGRSVAISGSTAVVGAPAANSGTGAADVFTRSRTGAWSQQAELAGRGGTSGDDFGWSVALSGSAAVVGAPGNSSPSGAAFVFARSGSLWSQQAELTAADGASGDAFGVSVALSGTTALVGADSANSVTGAAYVFARSGSTWSQQAELTATNGTAGDAFGVSVALSGTTALVGADSTNTFTGAAYVFASSGSTWSQQAELTATNGAAGDAFGVSVALSGTTALVGAVGTTSGTGAAYVFARSGSTWPLQAKLTATNGATSDNFGFSAALSGSTALLGAPGKDATTGAAYVFANV
jgi:hypothetical protein